MPEELRRMADAELPRMRDTLDRVAEHVNDLRVSQAGVSATVDSIKDTFREIKTQMAAVPSLERRVWLIERVVFGAACIILTSFLVALIILVFKPELVG